MTVVPAQRRRRRARRRRLPRRSRRRRPTRSCSAPPACSRSTRSSSPAARRRSGRSRTACRRPASSPSIGSSGPGNAWVTAAKIEVCGEVGIDLPAGPSEGMVLAAPPADPRRVAADLITQAEHGPDSPAILVTTDAAFADAVEAAVVDPARDAPPVTTSSPPPCATTAGSSSRPTWTRRSTSSTRTAPSTCRSTSSRSSRRSPGSATPGRCSSGRGRRNRPATTPPARTTSCRPAASPARPAPLSVETFGKFSQVQRIDREGLASIRETIGDAGRAPRACSPTATPSRSASRRSPPHEPDPGDVLLADRPGVVLVGGDRRAGRRPLRRAIRPRSSGSTSTPPPPRRPSSTGCWRPAGSRHRCRNTRRPTTAA